MDGPAASFANDIQDVLDELLSPRSSDQRIYGAIVSLERMLAEVCLAAGENHDFWALQYTFECNVSLRLLHWIAVSTPRLDASSSKDSDLDSEMNSLAYHTSLALTIIQGIGLNHAPSKRYLGRRYALEILLDLLLASRHIPAISPPRSASGPPITAPLSSVVIDTLLCILVDSTPALRALEEANGLQVIVKILKRAGTPREVRMKCLEFLYFYLLDETSPTPLIGDGPIPAEPNLPPTAPATPVREEKRLNFATPSNPTSIYGSSTYAFSTASSSNSSRSVSGSSTSSFSSTSSVATASTAPSSLSSSPEKHSVLKSVLSSTPSGLKQPKPRSLMMLQKDVDFVPLSPKKAQVAGLGVRPPGREGSMGSRHFPSKSITSRPPSRLGSSASIGDSEYRVSPTRSPTKVTREPAAQTKQRKDHVKTTKEKKELLGTMLGNVDALVEGVRKAGVWGLS